MWHFFWEAAWKVAIWSLVLGAGLPALFAVGVRTTVLAQTGAGVSVTGADVPRTSGRRALLRVIGIVCFVVVVAAVLAGLTIITAAGFGKVVSFQHVYPTIHAKS